MNLDCFLRDNILNEDQSIVYFKVMLMGLIPILVVFIYFAFFLVVACTKRKGCSLLKRWTVICMITVVYFFHPNITRSALGLLFCSKIDGVFYLEADLDQQCWVGKHYSLALKVGLPIIALWVISLPLFMFFYLLKNK